MVRLSVPGKTFLLGEYGALAQGPAVLLSTAPRFELIAARKLGEGIPSRSGLSFAGPSAEFLKDPFFEDYDLAFFDPYRGQGGFGGSSAQFVLLYALKMREMGNPILESEMVRVFRNSVVGHPKILPSGYDLLSQILGGVTCINPNSDCLETVNWKFRDLDFVLIRTGMKVPTHEHLESLEQPDFERLKLAPKLAIKALHAEDSITFVDAIKSFAHELEMKGWVAKHTEQILSQLRLDKRVLAAKGCGALGADVVLVLCRPEDVMDIRIRAMALGLESVASKKDLSGGLKIETQEDMNRNLESVLR